MIEWVRSADLSALTAEFCRRLRQRAGVLHGNFPVALTGGNSAKVFYDALAQSGEHTAQLDRIQFYWSDERLVPLTHPDSNFKLAADHLLRPANVKSDHIHPAPVDLPPADCAAAYAAEIRKNVPGAVVSTPQFPIIILGLGEDGHTGSLFPGRDPYLDDDLLVRAVEPTPDHPHPRLTFTPRLINAATHVWFVVTGEKKAWAVDQLEKRTATPVQVPALVADPDQTNLTIFTSV